MLIRLRFFYWALEFDVTYLRSNMFASHDSEFAFFGYCQSLEDDLMDLKEMAFSHSSYTNINQYCLHM